MKKFVEIFKKIQLFLGAASISIFFIAILLQILSRYTKFSSVWTGEVSTYSFIWSIMMGAGYMVSENKHFSFEMVAMKLSEKKKNILEIVIALFIMIFGIAILYYGILITKQFWNYRLINLPSIKMGYMWISLPILGFSIILYSINNIIDYAKKVKEVN